MQDARPDAPRKRTVPVESFDANPWGLYQVHGNVWEWCEDGWHDDYDGAPTDGSAWLTVAGFPVSRGGAWFNDPQALRSALRFEAFGSGCGSGFRVARTVKYKA